MFKSFASWLFGVTPVSRWVLLIILFGLACGVAGLVSYYINKRGEQ